MFSTDSPTSRTCSSSLSSPSLLCPISENVRERGRGGAILRGSNRGGGQSRRGLANRASSLSRRSLLAAAASVAKSRIERRLVEGLVGGGAGGGRGRPDEEVGTLFFFFLSASTTQRRDGGWKRVELASLRDLQDIECKS